MIKCKMKWQLITIIMLITITLASAEMCEDTVLLNEDCTMVTPTITCTSYTYDILNATSPNPAIAVLEKDNQLTLLNNSIYYLNFTYTNFTGDYIILLCDATSREVKVVRTVEEIKMIAIVLAFIFLIGLFVTLGFIVGMRGLKILCFGIALIEFLLLIGFMYAEYAGLDFTGMLYVNFILLLILGFFGGTLAMIMSVVKTVDPTDHDDEKDLSKWGKKWR